MCSQRNLIHIYNNTHLLEYEYTHIHINMAVWNFPRPATGFTYSHLHEYTRVMTNIYTDTYNHVFTYMWCVCVCVYVCVCVFVCVWPCVIVIDELQVDKYTYMHTHISSSTSPLVPIFTYIHIYVCTATFMCIHINVAMSPNEL